MAIDSAAKRVSALYFSSHRHGRLIPDGTIAGVDFLDIVGFYRGIEPANPFQTVTLESASVTQPGITASITQPGVTATVTQPTITISEKNDIT